MSAPTYDIVIPTIGRPSLQTLLESLQRSGAAPVQMVVVDDRTVRTGPAAARNRGVDALGHDGAEWVVFLDDDVVVDERWAADLEEDLAAAPDDVVAVQGRVRVPLPERRPATDWERHTARLEHARWITADLAVRRSAFDRVGGFDPRFRRAFREDSDFALRLQEAGGRLEMGRRRTAHPVRPSSFLASVRVQAGNREHARMRRRHGRDYRQRLGEGHTVWPAEVVAVALAFLGLAAATVGARRVARLALTGWLAVTVWFTTVRVRPGPRTADEVARMAVTSVMIPPAAVGHRVRGWWEAGREAGGQRSARRASGAR